MMSTQAIFWRSAIYSSTIISFPISFSNPKAWGSNTWDLILNTNWKRSIVPNKLSKVGAWGRNKHAGRHTNYSCIRFHIEYSSSWEFHSVPSSVSVMTARDRGIWLLNVVRNPSFSLQGGGRDLLFALSPQKPAWKIESQHRVSGLSTTPSRSF